MKVIVRFLSVMLMASVVFQANALFRKRKKCMDRPRIANQYYLEAHSSALCVSQMALSKSGLDVRGVIIKLKDFLDNMLILEGQSDGIQEKVRMLPADQDDSLEMLEMSAAETDRWIQELWDMIPLDDLDFIKQELELQIAQEEFYIDIIDRAFKGHKTRFPANSNRAGASAPAAGANYAGRLQRQATPPQRVQVPQPRPAGQGGARRV